MQDYQEKYSLLLKRRGTFQIKRLLASLTDNGTLLEENTLDHHLTFLYLYSDLIQYYALEENVPVHHNAWRRFLEKDETLISSLILHTRTDQLSKHVGDELFMLTKQNVDQGQHVNELLGTLQELVTLIHYWYSNLPVSSVVRVELEALISDHLVPWLSRLYQVIHRWYERQPSSELNAFCMFCKRLKGGEILWHLLDLDPLDPITEKTDLAYCLRILSDVFDAIFAGLSNLKRVARTHYRATFESKNHSPQAGLLIAFLRLLTYATDRLNTIPQRHLDFYYKDVLKFDLAPAYSDRVIVHFKLREGVQSCLLPKGSLLSAGKDKSGQDILFSTHNTTVLGQGSVRLVHVVHQGKGLSGTSLDRSAIDIRSYTAEMLNEPGTTSRSPVKTEEASDPTWPLLGLLIASPLLYLREGERNIVLQLEFTKSSFDRFVEGVRAQSDAGSVRDVLLTERVATSFVDNVEIHLTTKQGWFRVPTSHIRVAFENSKERTLEMRIRLTTDLPAIVDFEPDIHGPSYAVCTPAMRLGVSSAAQFSHIRMWGDLVLSQARMDVSVKDCRRLWLQNDLGPIDSQQPFEPFGPLADAHANFYIGSDEVFCKNVTHLRVNLRWEGLPEVEGGWQTHYRDYWQHPENTDFEVSVSYLSQRRWHPLEPSARQKLKLFSSVKDPECNITRLSPFHTTQPLAIERLNLTPPHTRPQTLLLTPDTLTGFLRLELTHPAMGFGHTAYHKLMTQRLIENAHRKPSEQLPLPPAPYTPLLCSVSIDYQAGDHIVFDTESSQLHHTVGYRITPFGHKSIVGPVGGMALLDQENIGCFLCFGCSDLTTSWLTLHVQINEYSIDPDEQFPRPVWQYLSDNVWHTFQERQVVRDNTDGLTKSGVLTLQLPSHLSTHHTALEDGLIWVRAAFPETLSALPELVGVYTHAVEAYRVISPQASLSALGELPAKSIQGLVHSNTDVEAVHQPFSTAGGRAAESSAAFYTRVSERLRHKGRALSAWDYERLVLEEFPDLLQVKCINHTCLENPNRAAPGKVVIVIVDRHKALERQADESRMPRASKHRLRAVADYLRDKTSPFVSFEVINPVYEEVKVNLEVKLCQGYERGLCLSSLQASLQAVLSPWVFEASQRSIHIGRGVSASQLIDRINQHEYVEGIVSFSVLHYTARSDVREVKRLNRQDGHLHASYPWTVLTSAAQHDIALVEDVDAYVARHHVGIEGMGVGEDFVVGPWRSEKKVATTSSPPDEPLLESADSYFLVAKPPSKRSPHGHS